MKLWFYHHFRTAYGSPMKVTSGSPWLVPRGIRKIKALLLARLIRCADPIVWGSEVDLATTLQSRSGHGENRVPHGWKNPMAPMIWRTQLGGFISVYLIFWHTHTHQRFSASFSWIGDISQGSEGEGDVEDHAITQEAITSWPYNAPFVQKRVPMDHQGLTRLLCL